MRFYNLKNEITGFTTLEYIKCDGYLISVEELRFYNLIIYIMTVI